MSNDLFTYYDIIVDIYGNMSLYSIQWQASHGNWSCYANKPGYKSLKNCIT